MRKAVRWISDTIQASEKTELEPLIHLAINKFDLNPREAEELIQFYQRSK